MSCTFLLFHRNYQLEKVLIIRCYRGQPVIVLESEARNELHKSQCNFQLEYINNWLRITEQQVKL